nr:MAG: hypothetical protein [Caudoviricetes sp.]
MSKFIEVNKIGDKSIVNLDLVKKIVPMINGVGCVLHFEQGTVNISESYDVIKALLIQEESQPKLLNEEVSAKKK